jgi:hypothetical protein
MLVQMTSGTATLPPRDEVSRRGGPKLGITLSVLALATLILFLRRPDQFTNPQLWAEDGIFYVQARVEGLSALFKELASYYHLAPRLIAALSNALDPAIVPHVFVGSTLLLTLYIVARVLSPRCALPARPVCALAVVLVPDASEVLLNTNNLQWVFALGFVLLLISDAPARRISALHDYAAAIIFGLTSPFGLALAPLFLLRAALRRATHDLTLAGLVLTCAAVQVASILRHPQAPPTDATFSLEAALAFPGIRVFGGLVTPWHALAPGHPLALTFTIVLLALLGWLALRPGEHRLLRVALSLALLASLASTIYRCWHSMPVLCAPLAATRYVFPPQVLFVWLLLATLRDRHRALRLGALLLLLIIGVNNATRLRIAPMPDKQWSLYASKLRAGEAVTIPINPDGWNFPIPARPPMGKR